VQAEVSRLIARKAPGFEPLNLSGEKLVSNFAFFKCSLYRYAAVPIALPTESPSNSNWAWTFWSATIAHEAGPRYKSANPVESVA
jgi:hypothetical protein